ncbi:MAG: lipid-A-disaccharide synthase [Alphaproteobacteria bacterium]|nr:lipid-A-disaccharide synthase [Alphaproteobacteria bacterium]
MSPPLRIALVAGEPSGDEIGARLMAALRRLAPGDVQFLGVGGPRMAGEGLASLFPYDELTVMGLVEVLPRALRLRRRLVETSAAIRAARPHALVTIDSPGFAVRLAERLTGADFPFIHYVAPTVWAWRPERARTFARLFDRLLTLLPFEPELFAVHGLASEHVGHPVLESGAGSGDGAAFRARHGLGEAARAICFLPGSRGQEVRRLLPVFAATAERLRARHPDLVALLPSLHPVAAEVRRAVVDWPVPVIVVEGEAEKHDAMAAAHAALAASGTVSLELALARLPQVIAYRLHPLTAWTVRRLIKVPHVSLVNLLAEKAAIPEFLQDDCRPDLLAAALERLLASPEERTAQQQAGALALSRLRAEAGEVPSVLAARAVLRTAEAV